MNPNSVTQMKLQFSKNIISMTKCFQPETFSPTSKHAEDLTRSMFIQCDPIYLHLTGMCCNDCFLSQFNHTGQGSICSQAIMLITDGAVDTYDTIFAKYNWPDRKVSMLSPLLDGKTKASYPI